jgi:pimeloyl-ACP methyl ester carboxylesterase
MSDTTFVLIPGAGGDAWYWHRVVPLLQQRGHEAIAVDLPAGDDSAGLPAYAQAVVEAIGDREPERIVLVAQSLGGFTAPMVCERLPVGLLVFVDAMIPRPQETPGEWFAGTQWKQAKRANDIREGRKPDAPFDLLVEFFHDVPQAVIDAALARGEPAQSDTIFASRCAIERWPDTPVRVLVSQHDRFFPAEFQKRLARERLGVPADEVPGGHCVALSQPEALTARLLSYIGTAASDSAHDPTPRVGSRPKARAARTARAR